MIIELEQNSPEWLEYRKAKFNASECGTVMGEGFVKPYKLAQMKYQDGAPLYQNKAMAQGHEYEPRIREWVEAREKMSFNPCVMQSDKDARFSASLDGYNSTDGGVILEIKFSANEYEHVSKHDKPSKKYYWQVQHQFFVSGAKRAIFAVGRLNDSFELEVVTCELKPCAKDILFLRHKWTEFEKEYKDTPTADDDFLRLADEITHKQTELKILETELKELKDRAIAKANGKECKIGTITIYKTERKPCYDYRAFCESEHLTPPETFLKQGSQTWGVRVTA